MNEKVKRRLLFALVIIVIIFLLYSFEQKKIVFVKDIKETKVFVDKDIKKVSNIIHDPVEKIKKDDVISTLVPKYEKVKGKDADLCTKDGDSSIVSSKKNFNVVVVELGNSYEYFKENNGKCSSLGKIENVNFTDNIVETYANDSIYTNFDSLSNFELSGLIRVKKDGAVPYDTVSKRYSNPTAIEKGVLLIENNRSVIAFDKEDKQMYSQNNDSSNRNVLSINLVNNSLFMIVRINKHIMLEGYEISDEKSISKAKPKLSYDVTKLFNNFDSEIVTKSGPNFGSFTSGGSTLVVKSDFSNVFSLKSADTSLAIVEDMLYLKDEEEYYVIDLANKEFEKIGSAQALNFKAEDKEIYFTILNSKGKEVYIRYKTR